MSSARGGVRLRALVRRDVAQLDAWAAAGAEGEFNDFGQPARSYTERLGNDQPGQEGVPEAGTLVVERAADQRLLGTVSWHPVRYGPNEKSLAYNIGIALAPEARGHGYGVEAQRLLAELLLNTTSVNRIEASTDIENLPEQRALEKAGFRGEGVLRGAQFRAGAWHDLIVYSRLRAEG